MRHCFWHNFMKHCFLSYRSYEPQHKYIKITQSFSNYFRFHGFSDANIRYPPTRVSHLSINLSCQRQIFRSGPLKGGLQEKMYFLVGCVRCASGKYDLNDRECDFRNLFGLLLEFTLSLCLFGRHASVRPTNLETKAA